VVTSRARDLQRRNRPFHTAQSLDAAEEALPGSAGTDPGPRPDAGAQDFAEAVDRALAVLARNLRARDLSVLEHRYLKGWEAERVAKALRISRENVDQICSRKKLALYAEVIRQLER
jgi:DNA-directed RNA polymerase specialized sigma24 family protein